MLRDALQNSVYFAQRFLKAHAAAITAGLTAYTTGGSWWAVLVAVVGSWGVVAAMSNAPKRPAA